MPIPDYQAIMLPLLRFAGDGKEHSLPEAIEHWRLESLRISTPIGFH